MPGLPGAGALRSAMTLVVQFAATGHVVLFVSWTTELGLLIIEAMNRESELRQDRAQSVGKPTSRRLG